MVTAQISIVFKFLELVIYVFIWAMLQKGNKIRPRIGAHGHANIDLLTDMTFINGQS